MCECAYRVDEELQKDNRKGLDFSIPLTTGDCPRVVLARFGGPKKGKRGTLYATYCPFCGERYTAPQAEPACAS